jgi:hypothetical protein
MSISRSQFWQTLAEDPLPTFRIYTEELASRKDQPGGDAFPRQVGQVPPISAVHFVRLPTAGWAGGLQRLGFRDKPDFTRIKGYLCNF